MNNKSIYLALAPNIVRRTTQDIQRLFPDLDLIPPQTHQEMEAFSETYGSGDIPALSICAYPQFFRGVLEHQDKDVFAPVPDFLPPMRRELTTLGLGEPSPYIRVVAGVPFVIAARKDVDPPITDWKDLCREDVSGRVAVPPDDTPVPRLFDTIMRATYGDEAEGVIAAKDTRFTPLDINKQVDAGQFAAGVSIPDFSRSFRNNGGHMVWPASGAWVVPLIACVRRDAAPRVFDFLNYLLSQEYQQYIAHTGHLVPVVEGVPWFQEMVDGGAGLIWAGWKALADLGAPTH